MEGSFIGNRGDQSQLWVRLGNVGIGNIPENNESFTVKPGIIKDQFIATVSGFTGEYQLSMVDAAEQDHLQHNPIQLDQHAAEIQVQIPAQHKAC